MIATNFTSRHRAMLRAIADGRGRLLTGRHPTLSVDGRWCDFTATNDLVDGDLVRPAWPGPTGSIAPAVLTQSGTAALAALSAATG
ncbi:MAG TPA: hypothetical protein VH969_23510 [Actinophytocola sp.]|jgi:hypothetical protein|uniref:hypothetical protein n=1 Tax=Actinophytocola sp. TaxID=1872138 RepID=UPI002F9340F9